MKDQKTNSQHINEAKKIVDKITESTQLLADVVSFRPKWFYLLYDKPLKKLEFKCKKDHDEYMEFHEKFTTEMLDKDQEPSNLDMINHHSLSLLGYVYLDILKLLRHKRQMSTHHFLLYLTLFNVLLWIYTWTLQ